MNEITLFVGVFGLLFVLSFSFPFRILPDIGGWGELLFNKVILLEDHVFDLDVLPYHSGEDSPGMFLNTINLFVIALLGYFLLTFRIKQGKISNYITIGIRYYLAIILLIYGFDKVYKWQFYSPESNILFTRVKDLPQDMLYWTTMGTSYSYSLFGGLMEVLAGGLLLFRKTYVIGALISIGVLANVFAVNIGFDITVKLYSGFLLVLSLVLLLPYIGLMLKFLSGKQVQIQFEEAEYSKAKWYLPLKVVLLLVVLVESQYKYVQAGNFNDDLAPRPYFNGAYDVIDDGGMEIVRIHFHRQGYFILEMNNEEFIDYRLEVEMKTHQFQISDYSENVIVLDFEESGDTLVINGVEGTFFVIAVKHEL